MFETSAEKISRRFSFYGIYWPTPRSSDHAKALPLRVRCYPRTHGVRRYQNEQDSCRDGIYLRLVGTREF